MMGDTSVGYYLRQPRHYLIKTIAYLRWANIGHSLKLLDGGTNKSTTHLQRKMVRSVIVECGRVQYCGKLECPWRSYEQDIRDQDSWSVPRHVRKPGQRVGEQVFQSFIFPIVYIRGG